MTKHAAPRHAVTAPKGRPTRARHDLVPPRRTFGPRLQWAAAIVLIAVAFALLFIWTT
jgi:hypothetical protein